MPLSLLHRSLPRHKPANILSLKGRSPLKRVLIGRLNPLEFPPVGKVCGLITAKNSPELLAQSLDVKVLYWDSLAQNQCRYLFSYPPVL